MKPCPSPSTKTPAPLENLKMSPVSIQEAAMFLKENLPFAKIIEAVRQRFETIDSLLVEAHINKHDQGHQWRSAMNAAKIMLELGLPQRDILVACAGALIHDIGYLVSEEVGEESTDAAYLSKRKSRFQRHALHGSQEAAKRLSRMKHVMHDGKGRTGKVGDVVRKLSELLSYKDADGLWKALDEKDIELIVEAILNHNDYGKKDVQYDPEKVSCPALAVQIGDKLDNCRQRVYKEHMQPKAFIKGQEGYDSHYFHRCVPFCITKYELAIDREEQKLRVSYHVDLDDFIKIVRAEFPGFKYENNDFVADFLSAYNKSCQVAAEAAGVMLDNVTEDATLEVELCFKDGEIQKLPFSRPDRPGRE